MRDFVSMNSRSIGNGGMAGVSSGMSSSGKAPRLNRKLPGTLNNDVCAPSPYRRNPPANAGRNGSAKSSGSVPSAKRSGSSDRYSNPIDRLASDARFTRCASDRQRRRDAS